jgi:iron complex outermembrane receptor protein
LAAKYGPGKNVFISDPNTGWRPYIDSGPNTDLYNFQPANYLITPSTRMSLFANGDYRLTDFARAYVQASFTNRQSSYLIAPEPLSISGFKPPTTIDATNPYNPFGVPLTTVRRRLLELSGRSRSFDLDTVRAVAGIDGSLPAEAGPLQGLFYDLSFNYGRTSGTNTTNGSLNTQFVQNGLGPAFKDASGVYRCGTAAKPIPNCTPVNLFASQGPITPDMAAALGAYKGVNQAFSQVAILQANVSKELVTLAADRPIGLAAGYEHRREYGGFNPNPIAVLQLDADFNSQPTVGSFNVDEGYAELNVPVISNTLGADDLELQAAVRTFKYSTFGSDSTYKVGGRWRPIRDFTIRGTYSTAFRAPGVSDLYRGAGPSAEIARDPCAKATPNSELSKQCQAVAAQQGTTPVLADGNGDTSRQINSTVGGNPDLKPETAKIGTVGVVFEPTFVRNFSLTADFWTVALSQEISAYSTQVILNGCYPASVNSTAPVNMEYCNLIQRSPTNGQISNVTDINRNVGSLSTRGIDLSARYTLATDYGRVGFLFDSTYLVKYDLTLAGGKLIKAAGNYDAASGSSAGGITPRIKFNAGVNYSLAGFRGGLTGRYIGGFTECASKDGDNNGAPLCSDNAPYPSRRVKAYMVFDLFLSYLLRGPVGNTTLALGVRNLADKTPPLIYDSFLTYADPQYDFAGRFVYGRVTHQF